MTISRRTFIASGALLATSSSNTTFGFANAGYPMRFAANIEMWWHKKPFLDRIHAAADAGFDAVEFWPWRNKDIDAVAKVSKERGVEIAQFTGWGFVPGMNNPKNHDAFVKEVAASCKAAKRMNCKRMTIVGGNDQPGMTQEEMHRG